MTEQRVYPVKDLKIVEQEQADYTAKIGKNRADGLKAFSTGEYIPFRGWPQKTSLRTFDTILELDESSQQRVMEEVSEPLREIAERHNIQAIYPGRRDNPPHVVLQPGKFVNLTPEQIETIKQYLSSNKSHLRLLARILEGLTFHHDSLVLGPSSYICASEFNAEQQGAFRTRRIVERMITHALGNLKSTSQQPVEGSFAPPFSYYDIFHSSVMRLTQIAPSQNLIAFAEEANATVGEDLRNNPIPVTVRNLFRGIATEYHRRHAPHLVLP